MSEDALDARELVRRVQAEKRAEQWLPLVPEEPGALQAPMRRDPRLVALHERWVPVERMETTAPGGGLKHLLLGPLRRLAYRLMGPYLGAERELLAQLVRTNDALAERCDELAQTIANRAAAEAENLAKLAAWLHDALDHGPDAASVTDRP